MFLLWIFFFFGGGGFWDPARTCLQTQETRQKFSERGPIARLTPSHGVSDPAE